MSAPSLPVEQRPQLAPWEAEPSRLWSLLDMTNTFKLDVLTFHLSNLERACAYVQFLLEPLNTSLRQGQAS